MKKFLFFFYFLPILFFLSCSQSTAENWYKVKWVADGDTITLPDSRYVRYAGINTPEIDHEGQKAEPYGYKAKIFNKKLVLSQKVRLEFDKDRYDQYGRLLAYVFLRDGTFVNAKIIEKGYAYCLPVKPNNQYDELFLRKQRKAMTAKKGIWKNWKENGRGCIGNRHSKRFHRLTCPFGRNISDKNRVFFKKKWDAFWEGFAPCKKCMPVLIQRSSRNKKMKSTPFALAVIFDPDFAEIKKLIINSG